MQKVMENRHIYDIQFIEFCVFLLLTFQHSLGGSIEILRPVKLKACVKYPSTWHEDCNLCICEKPNLRPVCTSLICQDPHVKLKKAIKGPVRLSQKSSKCKKKNELSGPEKLIYEDHEKTFSIMSQDEWSNYQMKGLTHLSYKWLKDWTENCVERSRVTPPESKCVSCVCEEQGVASCEMKIDCVLNT
ncbi:uncharacterized protein LOC125238550 isoform X2 [Leguminivora glycinivorella]|uniref:uncharacterized protein LOC125238550 isoform X2 n=1 Tax=Leguminivora glycinivorella TaxID=1035111 RepID=UPI00200BEF6F|nr:uncharacterized protein LOC125238550 isoform X2 [Leguminivora glycinivorella]